jgi:hypothetical protein
MKNQLSKIFALFVAISAVILVAIELANVIHMLGFTSSSDGFQVTYKADEPWEIMDVIRSIWYWCVAIGSILYILWGREKKQSQHTSTEE